LINFSHFKHFQRFITIFSIFLLVGCSDKNESLEEENLNIHPIPGPSAVTSAVSVSGFGDQYLFYGFLPKKGNKLESELKNLCNCDYAVAFFIPASKINFYISRFKKYFFGRKIRR